MKLTFLTNILALYRIDFFDQHIKELLTGNGDVKLFVVTNRTVLHDSKSTEYSIYRRESEAKFNYWWVAA